MRVSLLGVEIDNVSFQEARQKVRELELSGNRDYIVTPNPEFLVRAQSNSSFKDILNRASLAVPDGIGLLWASRVLGKPLQERVAGADLAEEAVALAAELGKAVFFLGGKPGIAEQAAGVMRKRYPGLRMAGTWGGSASPEGDEETREKIGPDHIGLLLVAYGHPKQELWLARNLSFLNFGVAIGVGGTFDYWCGRIPRAPQLVQKIGLEWLFRLFREPWRWRRQLDLIKFVFLVLKEKLSSR